MVHNLRTVADESTLWHQWRMQVIGLHGDGAVQTTRVALPRPGGALETYHDAASAADAQRLLDDYAEVRMAAVANWEALRKLVKKFDKNAPDDQALSGELLPKLYASSRGRGRRG